MDSENEGLGTKVTNNMVSKSWPASLESIPLIYSYAQKVLLGFGLGDREVDKVELALEEIAVNIISYAYRDSDAGVIDISLEKKGRDIIVHIFDNGVPFNPLETEEPDVDAPLEERTPGGLGIFMAKNLVDNLLYRREDDGNHLLLVKRLEK